STLASCSISIDTDAQCLLLIARSYAIPLLPDPYRARNGKMQGARRVFMQNARSLKIEDISSY
ncbi:hypothetical protein, partial [Pseudomonas syringae]|uniref:hypothetical protein n=1 Tax=Pseudomonas syringae TaxID=317 RepID=UPI001E50FFCF